MFSDFCLVFNSFNICIDLFIYLRVKYDELYDWINNISFPLRAIRMQFISDYYITNVVLFKQMQIFISPRSQYYIIKIYDLIEN